METPTLVTMDATTRANQPRVIRRVHHLFQYGYSIAANIHESLVEYTVYAIKKTEHIFDPSGMTFKYASKTDQWDPNGELVSDIDQAQPILSGSVDVYGNIHWKINGATNDGVFRCADPKELAAMGTVMAYCYDLTKTYCPDWEL